MIQLQIEVTQADIDEGIATSCSDCPIALAMRRMVATGVVATADVGMASVGLRFVYRRGPDLLVSRFRVGMPRSASRFIRAFDNFGKGRVRPFVMIMEVDDRYREFLNPASIVAVVS